MYIRCKCSSHKSLCIKGTLFVEAPVADQAKKLNLNKLIPTYITRQRCLCESEALNTVR